jgi:hypothetical protein
MSHNLGLLNHVAVLLDGSGSMSSVRSQVVQAVEALVKSLADNSRADQLNQETRITVYVFNTVPKNPQAYHRNQYGEISNVECIYYDRDVLRMWDMIQKDPLAPRYQPDGMTPLIDATLKVISDFKEIKEQYADHAFLIYALTDGQENFSNQNATQLRNQIEQLPANWTLACLVPDESARSQAVNFGFLKDNTRLWKTTAAGVAEVGRIIQESAHNFMQARATGVRGTTNLFQINAEAVTPEAVHQAATRVKKGMYQTLPVPQATESVTDPATGMPIIDPKTGRPKVKPIEIKTFVESRLGQYNQGSAFYQLTKPEKVQPQKAIVLREHLSGDLYTGPAVRQMLGLPNYEVRVEPAAHDAYDIFVQSTSVNRHLVPGTSVIVV